VDGELGRPADDRGVLVDTDHVHTVGGAEERPGQQVGHPAGHPVEMRQHPQMRQQAEPGLPAVGRVA
jgi:hypothetical protein